MSIKIWGFNPHPSGMDTRSSDLLEAILEQLRLGRTVCFDDDIGPDLGIEISKVVVNCNPRPPSNRTPAVRIGTTMLERLNEGRRGHSKRVHVKTWINDSDYAERMRKRNSAEEVAALVRELGRQLDGVIAGWQAKGWQP